MKPALPADRVPAIFREPNIYTGYRPPHQPWQYYLRSSLLQANNESLNVWTHLLAFLLATVKLFDYVRRLNEQPLDESRYAWPFFACYLTVFALYGASVFAHAFHSRSVFAHHVCFMVDYAGIGLYGCGIGLLHFYYCSELWFFHALRGVYPLVIALVTANVCFVGSFCKLRYSRPYPAVRKISHVGAIALMYLFIVLPLFPRFSQCLAGSSSISGSPVQEALVASVGPGDGPLTDESQGTTISPTGGNTKQGGLLSGLCGDPIMVVHLRELVWFLASGFFYGSDTPHRFFPGRCDFLGHGHQLFHVCITMTIYYGNEGVFLDMMSRRGELHSVVLERSFVSVVWPVIATAVLEVVIVICCAFAVSNKLKTDTGRSEVSDGSEDLLSKKDL